MDSIILGEVTVKSGLGPAPSPQYLFFTVYDQCHNSVIKTLTVTIINEVRINVYMSSKYKPENSCVCNILTHVETNLLIKCFVGLNLTFRIA